MFKLINFRSLVVVLILTSALYYGYFKTGTLAEASVDKKEELREVEALIVKPEEYRSSKEFSARLTAVNYAEIRPQVSGKITEVLFEDGQEVKEGEVLFVIDPRPYIATVKVANAKVAKLNNEVILAEKELSRSKKLIEAKAIAQGLYNQRVSTLAVAKAERDSAKASLLQAEINLDFAYVKAPFDGRLSRAEVTVGNVVNSAVAPPLLTTIVSSKGIYADFEVDEQTYLKSIRKKAKTKKDEEKIVVNLKVRNDSYQGHIHTFDNRLDPTSGTIRARAYFENKDKSLLYGMFANITLKSPSSNDRILIPNKAIGTNQDRKFVYKIADDGVVSYQEIKVAGSVNSNRVVLSGLSSGDTIITNGLMRVRPGMKVNPKIN